MKCKVNILMESLNYFLINFCFHDKNFYIIIIKVISKSKIMTIQDKPTVNVTLREMGEKVESFSSKM